MVLQHETKKKLYSIQKEAEKFRREFEVPNLDRAANERVTKFARRVKQKVKQQAQDIEVKQWEEKELHGRYPKRIREADVDDYKTNQWLRSAGLKAETEGLIIAAQDQSLPTKSYFARIVKDGTSPLCRICHKHEETVDHIISGCPELAKTDYLERHNKAATYIHWKACASITVLKSQRGGMNTSPRRLPKIKKSQFSGICRYIRIGNSQRTSPI